MVKTVAEIADLLDGQVVGDGDTEISGVSGIAEAGPGEITFLTAQKKLQALENTAASAIIVPQETEFPQKTLIRVADPRLAFAKVMRAFYAAIPDISPGVHPSAIIAERAQLGRRVNVGPLVCIDADDS